MVINKENFSEQVSKIASPKIPTQLKVERQKFRDEVKDVGEKLPKIKVGIGVDAKGFRDEVKNVGSQLPTVKVPVTVDSKFFKDETARIQEILDTIKPVSIKVNADTQQFISTIKECIDELHKLKDVTVTVKGKKPKEKPAAATEEAPKKAKGKAKKEMDYDELLTMLKINQFSDGISQSKSTVGARLKSVRNLQSAAMQGGWQPSADDLAWLANERNVLERKNEAVKLNNTRPGKNLIDEYIRQREQEAKAFREKLERQMNEEVKAEAEARKRRLAQEAQAAKEQKEYSDRTAKLLVQEKFAQTKEQEKAERDRLDANNKQLRENLKAWQRNNADIEKAKEEARKRRAAKEAQLAKEEQEAERARLDANNKRLRENLKAWQKNNTAIERAKEEARKRRLAKEAQEAKRQKEYSDRTTALNVKEKMQRIQDENKVAKAEKLIANRWQQFDLLDNVTPKAYLSMFQFLDKQISKIESLGGKYTGRVLTKTPEEYKASYVKPSTGIDEAARKQQNLNAIQERYNVELEKQNALMTYGTLLSQKQIDTAIRKLEALRKKYEELGGERSKLQLSDIETAGTTARAVNSAIVDRNVKAWSMDNVATVSQGLSHLGGMQQAQYNAWLQDPSKNNLKNLTLTTAEMKKLNREAQRYQRVVNDTNKTMESLNNKIHNHLSWMTSGLFIGTIFAIPAEVMNQWKELEYSLAGIRQVITEIEKNEGGNAFKEAFDLMEIAKKNGVGVAETMDAAKSIGRMYGKNPIDSNGVEEKGVGIRNTNLITSQAAKMAVADAFDMENAFKGLEAALSQWNLQTEDTNQLLINTNRILEAWTITAHAGAASAQDIGQAIEIAGTAAANAGVSFEFFNALVATGVRQTARSGNEIGQAIKSMMVSMQSNKSLKALKEWGIELYNVSEDGTKSMRSMEDIILDVSLLMNNTAKDTRGLLTTLSGGRPILASHSGNAV